MKMGNKSDRRRFLITAGAGAASLAMPLVLTPRKAAAATRITVTLPGGPYPEAYEAAFIKPFNEAMKGKFECVGVATKSNPTAETKAMVESKTYQWDLVGLNPGASLLMINEGYVEKVGVEDHPDVQEIPARFKTPYMIGNDIYATILAYRTDKYPASGRRPTGGWKDLWDVGGIPGRRGLRKHPFDTLEEAVLADGATAKDLYPFKLERAFKKLDEIKKHVKIWWTDGSYVSEQVGSNELDISPTWNGRIQPVIDAGAPVAISWNQGLVTWWGWNLLKGNPKNDACREFLKFAANAQRQAVIAKYMSYGPCNANAYKYIDQKRLPYLPNFPDNLAQLIDINAEFWGVEKDRANDRFNEWVLQ